MSQLMVRPGRNAARQAKRLKEIRNVKTAIQWHERERKKRQELKSKHHEAKRAVHDRLRWEQEHVRDLKKKTLRNAKEDWKLGPLRPNRAVGPKADQYGALSPEHTNTPLVPLDVQKNRNEVRVKKGQELEYPLIVDDKAYWPMAEGDRVVCVKGKDAGKLGTVIQIRDESRVMVVDGLRMQYHDPAVIRTTNVGSKPVLQTFVPFDDVRLVVPGEIIKGSTKRYGDVMVEKISMERHTTGIDPYTGTDYGDAEIPKDHQYDPRTGLAVFNRYIAGTPHRIEWPWERANKGHIAESQTSKTSAKADKMTSKTWRTTLTQPWTSLTRWTSSNKDTSKDKSTTLDQISPADRFEQIETQESKRARERIPRSYDPKLPHAHDSVDTTGNIVEDSSSMQYTLVYPPMPDTVGAELRSDIREFTEKSRKDPDMPRSSVKFKRNTEQSIRAREIARATQRAAEAMKTPMQLRWELEHKKKVADQKENPLVDEQALLTALGEHIRKNTAKPYLGKKALPKQIEEELD